MTADIDPYEALRPKVVVRYPIDPSTPLACHGNWKLFDQDEVTQEHRDLCRECPVITWCLEWAMSNNEFGIWAGTSRRQRRALRAAQLREQLRKETK